MQIFLLLALLFNFLFLVFRPVNCLAGPNTFDQSAIYDNLSIKEKDYWLKLLHYHHNKSRADGGSFFLSKEGKTNPKAEFLATFLAFQDLTGKSGWFNYHPQCVFRERLNFMGRLGLLKDVEKKECREFSEWKKGLNAESLTLIFSSSYPNNPSSLFGHTLIRLNQKGKKNDLLDYAIAFSAIPEKDDIGVVFAYKGMFGGYKGLLEVTKYYTKVNEYNNGESRDLIEYNINTTPDELERLINHLWEIYQTTYFDYYFADENCSAVLMDILAVPFFNDEVNKHRRWYYLPSEMIKVFKDIPGRVKAEHFRPSLKKQLEKRFSSLNSKELKDVQDYTQGKNKLEELSSIPVLDGVLNLLDFTRYRTKDKLTDEERSLFRKALLKRSALGTNELDANEVNMNKDYDQSNKPDKGHEPQKISFFTRLENSKLVSGVEFKEGYHDLMSNDAGYDSFSQFDFFTGSLAYYHTEKKINFDRLIFVNLVSLHPYKFYDPQFSWAANILFDRLYDLDCKICHKISVRAYLGPTFKPFNELSEKIAISFLLGPFSEVSKQLERGYRVGIGAEASLLIQLSPKLKMGLFDEIRLDAKNKIKKDYYNTINFKGSYFSNSNSEWRIEASIISKFSSMTANSRLLGLNYGHFF